MQWVQFFLQEYSVWGETVSTHVNTMPTAGIRGTIPSFSLTS